jgi:hypothetical protein
VRDVRSTGAGDVLRGFRVEGAADHAAGDEQRPVVGDGVQPGLLAAGAVHQGGGVEPVEAGLQQ